MLALGEYKRSGTKRQYAAIDEAIRLVQFIRNKSLRLWMNRAGTSKKEEPPPLVEGSVRSIRNSSSENRDDGPRQGGK
jgi:hypothetical protein